MRRLPTLLAAGLLTAAIAAGGTVTVRLVDAKGEPVADAAVSLVPLDGPVPPPAAATPPEVVQEDQQFTPWVTVVQVGTTVRFPNRDSVQHHVYSAAAAKKFEFPLYKPGTAESVTFDQPGVVALGCNIHDWMSAYLVVVPTPWFGKSGADGTVRLEAPDGKYRLEVWQPRIERQRAVTQEVTLAGGPAALDVPLKLRPAQRVRRAPDGKRAGY